MEYEQDDYLEDLLDELAGLCDSVETGDWSGAHEIAKGVRADATRAGWPLVGKLAGDLCAALGSENGAHVPVEAIEVLADAMIMCANNGYRKEDDIDEELREALESLKGHVGA